jgi:hypothetical protein
MAIRSTSSSPRKLRPTSGSRTSLKLGSRNTQRTNHDQDPKTPARSESMGKAHGRYRDRCHKRSRAYTGKTGQGTRRRVFRATRRLERREGASSKDDHKAYLDAIDTAFGGRVDYAMLVKLYGPAPEGQRRYSPAESTGAFKTPCKASRI